ncbi:MAG: hypothetical protein HC828_19750 [Blastochloris sp.]|nr:hypothetical protein [Blastochloris sp.]
MSSKPSSREPIFRDERAARERREARERAHHAAKRLAGPRDAMIDDATITRRRSLDDATKRPAPTPTSTRDARSSQVAQRAPRTAERSSAELRTPRISMRSVGDEAEETPQPVERGRIDAPRTHAPPRSQAAPVYREPPPPHYGAPRSTLLQPGFLALVALVSIIIILLTQGQSKTILSNFNDVMDLALPPPQVVTRTQPETPPGQHSVVGAPQHHR